MSETMTLGPPARSDVVSTLSVRDLTVSYNTGGGRQVTAVDRVSFDLRPGTICGLVGESGCGKSTVSLALMGLLSRDQAEVTGSVTFGDDDLLALAPRRLRQLQGKSIAMIFQDPMSSMNPTFTVGYQICEPMRVHLGLSRKEARARAIDLLRRVGIADPAAFLARYPHELSGGMRQRAMIAMAMSCRPRVLLADEPTTALDVTIQAEIIRLIVDLSKEEDAAVLFITHDLGVVAETCDEVLVMYAGHVVESGTDQREVLDGPRHPYTAALLNCLPETNIGAEELPTIPGAMAKPGTVMTGCRFADRCSMVTDQCRAPELPTGEIELRDVSDARMSRCVHSERVAA